MSLSPNDKIHAIFVEMTWSLNDTYLLTGSVAAVATVVAVVMAIRNLWRVPPVNLDDPLVRGDTERVEQAICQKVESEFSIAMRQYGKMPIKDEQLARIKKNIERTYGPGSVFYSSPRIRADNYLMPLIIKLIKIETDLRGSFYSSASSKLERKNSQLCDGKMAVNCW
jgi:hypothetical protein